jgi:hypothetical protein
MLSRMPFNFDKLIGALFHTGFNDTDFRDLWGPVILAGTIGLVVAVVLYNVNTRRLHRHPVLVNREEWLLWTAISVFGLLIVESVFHFYLFFVVLTLLIGLPTFVWIVFRRFPPMIEAYNQQPSPILQPVQVQARGGHDPDQEVVRRAAEAAPPLTSKRRAPRTQNRSHPWRSGASVPAIAGRRDHPAPAG